MLSFVFVVAVMDKARARKDEVEGLVSQGNNFRAVQVAITDTITTKDDKVKAVQAEAAAYAIGSVSGTEMKKMIKDFSFDEQYEPRFLFFCTGVSCFLSTVCRTAHIRLYIRHDPVTNLAWFFLPCRAQLMKFCYKAMAIGNNCAALLSTHKALLEIHGPGFIMQALTDKKI